MKKLYESPKWRALISGILTCIVGVTLAVLGNWDFQQKFWWFKFIFFCLFSILNVVHLFVCAVQDSKELLFISELKKQNGAVSN